MNEYESMGFEGRVDCIRRHCRRAVGRITLSNGNTHMRKLVTVLFVVLAIGQAVTVDAKDVDMKIRARELKDLRFGMFICWSLSTFSGYEWTPGVDDVSFFNPTGFEPDQWCRTVKDAGMNYILFLTKHHDGFCLWDTQTTERKVTNSPLQIDVLRELKKTCDKYGIKLALYFSEGDWSWSGRKDIHTSIARPEIKKAQLRELLTQYGPIEYIWFDHAIGEGGLSHEETAKFVKSIQPACFIGYNHGDQTGADIRIGERGKPAPLEDVSAETIGSAARAEYMKGQTGYYLAEFTYPILEGQGRSKMRGAQWFYSLPENDDFACTAEKIYADYLGAEEYGNIFSLDVGPDRAGKIRDIDVKTLKKVGRYIRGEIKLPPEPVSTNKSCSASSIWSEDYGADKAFDNDPSTRWGAEEGARSGWLQIDLERDMSILKAIIDEGSWHRIRKFELQVKQGSEWETVAAGTTVGPSLEVTFSPKTARQVRLNIIEANEVPTILEFSLYTTDQ